MGDEWEARSVLQSGGAAAGRFRMLHRQEVSGNRKYQPARRGEVGCRLHRCCNQQYEQGLFPARERSGIQRLCGEDYRRLGGVPGDAAGQVGQAVHAGSGKADLYNGGLTGKRRTGEKPAPKSRVLGRTREPGSRVLGRSEMRKQQLTMFVALLVFAAAVVAAAAQTPASQPAGQRSELERVNVVRGTDEIRVEISSHGAVTPKLSSLDSPARVVVELPETVMASGQSRILVGTAGVKGVRIGMDGRTPPTTRVVVDLEKACAYELTPGPAGKLVLTLHAQAAEVGTTASVSPSPSASPFTPKVVEAKETTALKAAASDTTSPNKFVMVEPTYQAKKDEPAVRAQEAAARFSDKTAAELLPVSMNAAQAQSSTGSSTGITPAVNLAAEQKAQQGQQPASSGPKYTGEPISVNLKDVDLKDFFRLVHEISGLNVVLDPNVHGTLTIVLDDVPWDQALDIVLKNNELARELEGNVLRIATVDTLKHEADGRRAQVEAEALAVDKVSVTRFLSYAKAKDVIVTVKKFISQRGDVVADDRTNAVIINDIPKSIPTIDRLLTQLDRKTQEVEIEARVVAATRQFARDIGTQLGFGWGDGHSAIGGAAQAGSSPTTVSGLTPGYITVPGQNSSTGSSIPLFSNLGSTSPSSGLTFLNASNTVRIDAVLTMAESRGLLKVLSRPRVVTQNNIQALVKQG